MESVARPTPRNKLRGMAIMKGYETQQHFADAMGVSMNTVHGVFRGWRFPSPQFQVRAAAALGISVKDLKKLL